MSKKIKKNFFLIFFLIISLISSVTTLAAEEQGKTNTSVEFIDPPKEAAITKIETVMLPREENKNDRTMVKIDIALSNVYKMNGLDKLKNRLVKPDNILKIKLLRAEGNTSEVISKTEAKTNVYTKVVTILFTIDKQKKEIETEKIMLKVQLSDEFNENNYLNNEIKFNVYFTNEAKKELTILEEVDPGTIKILDEHGSEKDLLIESGVSANKKLTDKIDDQEWLEENLYNINSLTGLENKREIGTRYTYNTKTQNEKYEDLYEYYRPFVNLMSNHQISGYGFEPKVELFYSHDAIDEKLLAKVGDTFLFEQYDSKLELSNKKDFEKVMIDKLKDEPEKTWLSKERESQLPDEEYQNTSLIASKLATTDVEYVNGEIIVAKSGQKAGQKYRAGGAKLYYEFWPETVNQRHYGRYKLANIGLNDCELNIKVAYKITGYMYNHLKSQTMETDRILLSPVEVKDAFAKGVPDNWSQADIDWLKKK